MQLTTTLKKLKKVTLFPLRKDFKIELFFPSDHKDRSGTTQSYSFSDGRQLPNGYLGSPARALGELHGLSYSSDDETQKPTVINIIHSLLRSKDTHKIEITQKFFFGLLRRKRVIGGSYWNGYGDNTEVFTNRVFTPQERQATIDIFQVLGKLYGFEVIVDESCCDHHGCKTD